MGKYNVVRI